MSATKAGSKQEARLSPGMSFGYLRGLVPAATVRRHPTILSNVAPATHGKTHTETLGSGESLSPTLRMDIRSGRSRSICLFLGTGKEKSQIFKVSVDQTGCTAVVFGDGKRGARMPTGAANIRATYRSKSGVVGKVTPAAVTTLLSRPLQLDSVTNPQPAPGGADQETTQEVRRNAPSSASALDRRVSTRDFSDLASSFTAISKASTQWTWSPQHESLFTIVAAIQGSNDRESPAATIVATETRSCTEGREVEFVLVAFEASSFARLLPEISTLRQSDGEPPRTLLTVLEEHMAELRADIDELWKDVFVERTKEWVVRYVGALLAPTDLSDRKKAQTTSRRGE